MIRKMYRALTTPLPPEVPPPDKVAWLGGGKVRLGRRKNDPVIDAMSSRAAWEVVTAWTAIAIELEKEGR